MKKDHPAPHHSQARGGPLQDGLLLPARGLLFDNDGVLVDSEAGVVAGWSRWAVEADLDAADAGPGALPAQPTTVSLTVRLPPVSSPCRRSG